MRSLSNERGVILSWLVKLVLGLAIAGVILFDTGSIAINYFGLDSAASETANALATEIKSGSLESADLNSLQACGKVPSSNPICAAAERQLRRRDAKLVKIGVNSEGILRLKVRRTANTLVVKRIGAIEDWAKATADARSSTL